MLKPELFELCKRFAPPPKFKLDGIAESDGHTILRTPPYHPELQPIEKCWGIVKNHCRDHCDFTMNNLHQQLSNGMAKITQKTCKSLIKDIYEEEEKFWQEDAEIDNEE